MSAQQKGTARIAIDRGGTFTDAICSRPGHSDIVIKVCPDLIVPIRRLGSIAKPALAATISRSI